LAVVKYEYGAMVE